MKKAISIAIIAVLWILLSQVSCLVEGQGRIAFVSNRDGETEIYMMNADGTNQYRLTYDLLEKEEPAWSYDGKFISYHGKDSRGRTGIYLINVDGTNQRQLTSSSDQGAVWSPDTQSIAFHSYRDGNWEIFVMNRDGTNQRNISRNPNTDTYPNWSPDARFIVFHTQRDGNWEIYVMNADGTNQHRLTYNEAEDWVPAWSPNGQKIAFWSHRDGTWEVYTMHVDGSKQERITKEPARAGRAISRPAWSHNSRLIAFVSTRDGNSEIYIMNADGTNQRRLTNNDKEDYDPAWAHIGGTIMNQSLGGGKQLITMFVTFGLLIIPILFVNAAIAKRKGRSQVKYILLSLIPLVGIYLLWNLISLPDKDLKDKIDQILEIVEKLSK